MQFVNIVVHSVENMNFRVHLQHEFSIIGLDDYLEVCAQFSLKPLLGLNNYLTGSLVTIRHACELGMKLGGFYV